MSLPTESLILVTGLPGAGKTLYAVDLATKYAAEGVRVFSCCLDGASPELFEVLPDNWSFDDWQSLPQGSVVIFDEAHKILPTRTRDAPPKAIRDLTEIRHFGLRFILITQDPRNIDVFVRRLIGRHFHLTRKMGLESALVKEWDHCVDDPSDFHEGKKAISSLFRYPKKLYNLYKSSTMHLVKKRIPFKVVLYAVAFFVILAFVGSVFFSYSDRIVEGDIIPGTGSNSIVAGVPSGDSASYDTLEDYLIATTSLSPVLPWTAPIYEGKREIKSVPGKLVCYIGSRGCRCFTDQMTRVKLPEPVCVSIVKDGVYNPYAPPYEETGVGRGEGAGAGYAAPPPTPTYLSIDGGAESVPGSGAFGVNTPR